MSYAKIVNGQVEKYPYSAADLRAENPNVSYPEVIRYGFFVAAGALPVNQVERPEVDHTKNLAEGTPEVRADGSVWQVWVVSDATEAEIADRVSAKWEAVRSRRNRELEACDWTQLPDVPLFAAKVAEWAVYRQALRDVTNQPDPFHVVFPAKPE